MNEERKGNRERGKGAFTVQPSGYTLHLRKINDTNDRQVSQLVRRQSSQSKSHTTFAYFNKKGSYSSPPGI